MTNVLKEKWEGQIFGDLTIIEYLGRDKNGSYKIIAKCKCGIIKEYYLANLIKRGHTTSCGCTKSKKCSIANKTHGVSIRHPLHIVWNAMKGRCGNPNKTDYANYGAKGVVVCELWKNDFKAFYDWALANGWQKGMNIDKDIIPKKIGIPALLYSPEMCLIVTSKENQNGRSNNIIVEYKKEVLTLKQVAEKYNVRYLLLWNRYVKLKWPIERAIITPPRKT